MGLLVSWWLLRSKFSKLKYEICYHCLEYLILINCIAITNYQSGEENLLVHKTSARREYHFYNCPLSMRHSVLLDDITSNRRKRWSGPMISTTWLG